MGYGLVLFLWFSPEDNQVWPVTLLGAGMAALFAYLIVVNKLGGKLIPARYFLVGAPLLGILVGMGASVSTTGLMFFKNALHAHLFLDYPAPMLLAMLERAPIWGAAGGFCGLGAVLMWLLLRRDAHESGHEYP
jgi:hypothetical protein